MSANELIVPFGWLLAAVGGLGVWRYQLISKRRYEIAEQALTAGEAAAMGLHYIRQTEADALSPENETAEFRPDLFVLRQGRFQQTETSFSALDQASKAIAMHFGNDGAKPFCELQSVQKSLIAAHLELYRKGPAERLYPTTEQRDRWEQSKRTLSIQGADDPITRRIDDSCALIRHRFGKYLRPPLWRLFLPFWD